ncbi:MAG: polyphosphate kinase 1 [Spirochaetaceae bacterium]|nr:MAG: polyphosphate kinase 1 [Spirochaetaceae bacterium]
MSKQYKFGNRELSWLQFNRRVLSEAFRAELPLLERLKFLCIVTSNLDEFFMVRVATVKRQYEQNDVISCPSGMSPQEQLEKIAEETKSITDLQYACLLQEVLPGLASHGISLLRPDQFDSEQEAVVRKRFFDELYPLLTPVRLAPGKPLPYLGSLNVYGAFQLGFEGGDRLFDENNNDMQMALVPIPSGAARLWYLPSAPGTIAVVLLEDVIKWLGHTLFPGYKVENRAIFRVTRDADFGVDEDRDEDFVEAMEQVLARRDRSRPVRLAVDEQESPLIPLLMNSLRLKESDVFYRPNPIDITPLMELTGAEGFENLQVPRWRPLEHQAIAMADSIWQAIAAGDILLHHPYDSFDPVIRMLEDAADDPAVLAIKMTLYRTSGDSPIVRALERAAKSGKQVAVLVEIKARFDEGRNIEWAERLEKAGALVVFGIARLKVHAKATLIVRREEQGIRRYVHLGTGNYNDKTARLYTDYGLMSCRPELAYDVGQFFNAITGFSAIPALKKLVLAPVRMKQAIIELINREAQKSSKEAPGRMIIKLNSLADADVITALYEASQQHVQIDLIVRGICMLLPGIPGQSESIRVISVIDKWLEHTRALYFRNGGNPEVYFSSADWMPRNLERRVELMIPVDDERLRRQIIDDLELYRRDNTQAHLMQPDGNWVRLKPEKGRTARGTQATLCMRLADTRKEVPENYKEFPVRRNQSSSR